MWFLFLIAAIAGPAVVFYFARRGEDLRREQAQPVSGLADGEWPSVGLIIPAAGTHPDMETSIRSLLSQSYSGTVEPVIVTATDEEPAADLARRLQKDFPALRHVIAGEAEGCGQKNHNSLAGVKTLGKDVEIYAFCDSTHEASPDFLRRLVSPIALGRAEFTTGYHEVVPQDDRPFTLVYTMCVLFMRLMQALASLTEPWGGAMAVRRRTFDEAGIAGFWSTNVVDDCSLTTFLKEKGVRVKLCPGALLRTRAADHKYSVWRAWIDRQILFLKFCVPAQWVLLGIFSFIVFLAPFMSVIALLGLVVAHPSGLMLALTFLYLGLAAVASARLRPLVSRHIPMVRWYGCFLLLCVLFFVSFLSTVRKSGILWHGIWYEVRRGGRVESITRR